MSAASKTKVKRLLVIPLLSLFSCHCVKASDKPRVSARSSACEKKLMGLTPSDRADDTFLKTLLDDPVGAYRQLERQAEEARSQGKVGYSFPQRQPFLLKIIIDLNDRLKQGSVLELPRFADFRRKLSDLRRRAIAIFKKGIPSRELNAFAFDYAETLDALFRSADPSLSGTYHRDFAQGVLKGLLAPHEGTHLFFTSETVSDIDLLHLRPTATYLHWLIDPPRFLSDASQYQGGPLVDKAAIQRHLDGLDLDLEEIVKHDAGHSWYMKAQDEWLFKNSSYTRLALVEKWTRNKNKILGEWTRLEKIDHELGAAARFLISEIVHERGFQYHLPILRQQFGSAKWIDILRFKRKNNYWGKDGLSDGQDRRLEEARLWIVKLLERLNLEDMQGKIASLDAMKATVTLRKWNPIMTYSGVPVRTEIHGPRDIRVTFAVPGVGQAVASIYDISLVLGPTASTPILTAARINRIEKQLWKNRQSSNEPDPIVFLRSGALAFSKEKSSRSFPSRPRILSSEERFSKIELYKLERLLFMQEQERATAFSVTAPPVDFAGKVAAIDPENGHLDFIDDQGQQRTFRLEEISIQPR